jgi:hypothetical protein
MQQSEWLDYISLYGFSSVLLFQFLFIGLQWAFIRRREYIYYLSYMLGIGTFSVLKYSHLQIPWINQADVQFLERKLDLILPIFSYFLYYRFARTFLELPDRFPKYNNWIKKLENVLLTYIAIDIILVLFNVEKPIREIFYHLNSLILFSFSCFFIFIFLKMKIKLTYFIVIGALVLNIGGFTTMILYVMRDQGVQIGFHPMLVSNLTNIFELLAFSSGLSYKAMLIDKERLKSKELLIKNLEENFALQEKLHRIRQSSAHELHNEIASGMSDLSIYTGLIEKEIHPEQDKIRFLTSQIRSRSIQMLDTLYDLIWSLNPENRSLEQLKNKLIQISREKLVPYDLSWSLKIEEDLFNIQPDVDLMRKSVSVYRNTLEFAISNNAQFIDALFDAELNAFVITLNLPNQPIELGEQFEHQLKKANATSKLEFNRLQIKLCFTRISD